MADPRRIKRVYGRRIGRPLKQERSEVLAALLPGLEINAALLAETGDLAPAQLFGERHLASYALEIGFGAGEHLAAMIERRPDCGFIGAEPFVNGMAAFLKTVRDRPDPNVRVLMDDAMMIVNSLENQSLDNIYILNPDPWHKKRHHKRRIVSPANLDRFARVLRPGGLLVMSTDVPDLADWMVTHAARHPAFEWLAETAADWHHPPTDWVHTRYEAKGAKGAAQMVYLLFRRRR